MVNQQILEGNWSTIRGEVRRRWGQLTDDELAQISGDAERLIGLIQQKTGQARERVEAELEDVVDQVTTVGSQASQSMRGMAHEARARAEQRYEEMAEGMRQTYENAQQTVQRHPVESMAVAFGSGLVAGVILGLILRPRD